MKRFALGVVCVLFFAFANAQNDSTHTFVYQFVETPPKFPGGDKALMTFLAKNIQYPKECKEKGIQGNVLVKFIVNENGSVSDVVVVRSVNPAIDSEAIRVVKTLPYFTPPIQEGRAVRMYFNLPVVFKLVTSGSGNPSSTEDKSNHFAEKIRTDKYFAKAVDLAKKESYEQAIGMLTKSIAKFPTDYMSFELLAECDFKTGKKEDACSYWHKAEKLGSPYAGNFLKKHCSF